jgi:hypothetical protein
MAFTKYGIVPTLIAGSSTTYYPDAVWINNSIISYVILGCDTYATKMGAFVTTFSEPNTASGNYITASISCKPLASIEEVE